jgi:polyhydroxyalkanoate synthesis regulator phasin
LTSPRRAAYERSAFRREVRMLRDNDVLKKMIATGEERVGKIASQLLSNEKIMAALQKTVSAALEAKGAVERNLHLALSTLNVPTSTDVKKLEGKIEELERVFEGLSAKITELQKRDETPRSH